MLVMTEGHGSDGSAHFNETAKTFLRGVLVHVATLPGHEYMAVRLTRV